MHLSWKCGGRVRHRALGVGVGARGEGMQLPQPVLSVVNVPPTLGQPGRRTEMGSAAQLQLCGCPGQH